jgi:hypothetical protein
MKAKVKRIVILTLIAVCISIGIQAQPAYAFDPTIVRINPQIVPPDEMEIPCPGSGKVQVEIIGLITALDQQAGRFLVRLVQSEIVDDILGEVMVTRNTTGNMQWQPFLQGQVRSFNLAFDIHCNEACEIVGVENTWQREAILALEIGDGGIIRWENHYDTAWGNQVRARCVNNMSVGGIQIPVDKLGLLTPYIGLAAVIIFSILITALFIKRSNKEGDTKK